MCQRHFVVHNFWRWCLLALSPCSAKRIYWVETLLSTDFYTYLCIIHLLAILGSSVKQNTHWQSFHQGERLGFSTQFCEKCHKILLTPLLTIQTIIEERKSLENPPSVWSDICECGPKMVWMWRYGHSDWGLRCGMYWKVMKVYNGNVLIINNGGLFTGRTKSIRH